ncbi:hypothetical protein CLV68_0268 [Actinokineospora cianjurensis]|uniref:Uncharacterized protein n=1 Tax=Actinokineospora cianjurensis TaxID=585224 RepID=A0A421B5Z7_9PSEU|nr:hypothetical protein CLV68_0268 [Actinokineospora cianjurensis]
MDDHRARPARRIAPLAAAHRRGTGGILASLPAARLQWHEELATHTTDHDAT